MNDGNPLPLVKILGVDHQDERLLRIVCNSLRFSTHCRYVVVSPSEPREISPSPYFSWRHLNSVDDYAPDFTLEINESSLRLRSRTDPSDGLPAEKYDGQLHHVCEVLRDSVRREQAREAGASQWKATDPVTVDAMIDYEGDFHILGAVREPSGAPFKTLDASTHLSSLQIATLDHPALRNRLVSVDFNLGGGSEAEFIQVRLDQFSPHWELYRSLGVNVPLIFVQSLLERKVVIFPTVGVENLDEFSNESGPKYALSFSTAYIDLDETLLWMGSPITEIIDVLNSWKTRGVSLRLLTRHKKVVADTLRSIGLLEDTFDEIIVVRNDERKSEFVHGESIFIDNEFLERQDVRLRAGVPVLNLDQIDFL